MFAATFRGMVDEAAALAFTSRPIAAGVPFEQYEN